MTANRRQLASLARNIASVTLPFSEDRSGQLDEAPAISDLLPVADSHPDGALLSAFSQLDVRQLLSV